MTSEPNVSMTAFLTWMKQTFWAEFERCSTTQFIPVDNKTVAFSTAEPLTRRVLDFSGFQRMLSQLSGPLSDSPFSAATVHVSYYFSKPSSVGDLWLRIQKSPTNPQAATSTAKDAHYVATWTTVSTVLLECVVQRGSTTVGPISRRPSVLVHPTPATVSKQATLGDVRRPLITGDTVERCSGGDMVTLTLSPLNSVQTPPVVVVGCHSVECQPLSEVHVQIPNRLTGVRTIYCAEIQPTQPTTTAPCLPMTVSRTALSPPPRARGSVASSLLGRQLQMSASNENPKNVIPHWSPPRIDAAVPERCTAQKPLSVSASSQNVPNENKKLLHCSGTHHVSASSQSSERGAHHEATRTIQIGSPPTTTMSAVYPLTMRRDVNYCDRYQKRDTMKPSASTTTTTTTSVDPSSSLLHSLLFSEAVWPPLTNDNIFVEGVDPPSHSSHNTILPKRIQVANQNEEKDIWRERNIVDESKMILRHCSASSLPVGRRMEQKAPASGRPKVPSTRPQERNLIFF